MISRVPPPALPDLHPGLRLAGPVRLVNCVQGRRTARAASRDRAPIAAASSTHLGPIIPSPTSARSGSSADSCSAALSAKTSGPHRSLGQGQWPSSGTPQAPAERRRDRIKIPVHNGTVVPVVCGPIGVSRSCSVAGARRPEGMCGEPDDVGVDRDLDGGVDETVVWPAGGGAGCGLTSLTCMPTAVRSRQPSRAARRLILPNSGHLPHFEVPGVFNTAVLGFLTTHLHRSERSR
jgi:hypothetical protein